MINKDQISQIVQLCNLFSSQVYAIDKTIHDLDLLTANLASNFAEIKSRIIQLDQEHT